MIETITGVTKRLVHISPTGGAIFRIQPEGDAKTVRVVASSKALHLAPEVGESLTIVGQYVNDRKYGNQFMASSVVRRLPEGKYIIKLLVSHPRFTWLGSALIHRLWKSLGVNLYATLEAADVVAVASATKMPLSDAIRLVREWRAHAHEIATYSYFAINGLPLDTVQRAIQFWGKDILAQVSVNPYILVPLSTWTVIDTVCTGQFGIKANDYSRLIAACTSSAEKYMINNRAVRIPMSDLRKSLTHKLGTASLAVEAITFAQSSGSISIFRSKNSGFAQTLGMSILERALTKRVASLASMGPIAAPDRKQALCDDQVSPLTWQRPGVSLLRVSCYGSVSSSGDGLEDALHLFLSTSMHSYFRGSRQRTALLSDVLRGDYEHTNSPFVFAVYGADSLDLMMATKLLYALPKRCHLVLISMIDTETVNNSFWYLLGSLHNVSQYHFESKDLILRKEKEAVTSSEATSQAAIEGIFKNLTVFRMSAESLAVAQSKVLATYRQAVENDATLLLTIRRSSAARLNQILHSEYVDLRRAMHLPTPLLSLYDGREATIDERIVARSDIYDKHILTGALGVITEIFFTVWPQGATIIPQNLVIATAKIDTVGLVGLTASDCAMMDLGYAVPAEFDRWGGYAHRIVFLDGPHPTDLNFIQSQASRTVTSLHIIDFTSTGTSSCIPAES